MTRVAATRALLSLVVSWAAAPVQAAVVDLTDVVPSGSPVVYYVADVPGAMDRWATSPLAELWNDPQVQTFFAPLRAEFEVDDWDASVRRETGYSLDEIVEMFTGDLVVYLESFAVDFDSPDDPAEISMAILAALGENAAKFEEMILKQEEDAADEDDDDSEDDGEETLSEIREFRGIALHIESVISDGEVTEEYGWAVVDGYFAFGWPSESLENAVAGILDEGIDDPLRSGTNFATISKYTRDADAWFFFDIEPWVPLARQAIEEGLAAAQESGSAFPVDPATLMDALGIEGMQALFATIDFSNRNMAMDFGATYSEDRGLIKLLAYGPGQAPRSAFIPVDSDSFTTAAFDFGASWSALVEIINGINPALMGMAAMQLQSLAQSAGVELDLRRDLLENLTGEMASIQNLDGITGGSLADMQLQQEQVISLGIKQREAMENAIETIKTMVGQGSQFFSERDFEGHTIFTLDLPQEEGQAPGSGVAYAVTDGHLWISMGSPATLEKVLLKLGSRGESVWKLPTVKQSLAMLPEGAAAVQYQDFTTVGDLVFRAIAIAENLESDDDEGFQLCDPAAVPDPGTFGKYLSSGVSGVWKDNRSLVIRTLVLPTERD